MVTTSFAKNCRRRLRWAPLRSVTTMTQAVTPDELEHARRVGMQWASERGAQRQRWPQLECDGATFFDSNSGSIPTLHLEDVSAIPFVSVVPGVELYQHRARVRAGDGDVFAAVTPVSNGYEPYCRDTLQLGSPRVVMAEPVTTPTAVARACSTGKAWRTLIDWARSADRILIHPYMAIGDVWELGAALKAQTGREVRVLGPTLDALWTANDKSSLSETAEQCLGPGWIMRTERATDIPTLAAHLRSIATHSERVGLKRTRCASAMGNIVYQANWAREAPQEELERELGAFLDRTQWDGMEEVLAVEWGLTDISPSTQMWIPPVGAGEPILQGIYEQLLEGVEKVFLGSRPSSLPARVHADLERASMMVSAAFQAMGYVGRCSFDFIVLGDIHDPSAELDVRFTECNGRWGGTSTPMHLVDRLDWRDEGGRKQYRAQDFVRRGLVGATFADLHAALKDELFDPRTRSGRFVLYNVGPLETDGKFDVVSLGRTYDEAVEGIEEVIPRRLGVQ